MISKKIFAVLFVLVSLNCFADEGMWIPTQLKQKEAELKAKGLQIPIEEVFSNDGISLKNAVVQFGTGCTGEVISDQGLVLTNHHCGFSQIQSLSTVEHNHLKDGFWARSKSEELPCPGLTITFIVRIENVTDQILPQLTASMTADQREAKIAELGNKIEKESTKGTKYTAQVKSFYYGNEFYLFVKEVFKDIRFVGAPPVSIGKFGGETDNWIWPRHTGDFSMFRIYANAENNPADYSTSNVPYKPKKYFTINVGGTKEDEFNFVYGFPGTTKEYLPSSAVRLIQNINDPTKVKIRDTKLNIWQQAMKSNDTIRLQYASKFSTIANYYKKWKGEIRGLEKADAIGRKQAFEKDFNAWANAGHSEYNTLLKDIDAAYADLAPYSRMNDYYAESVLGIEILTSLNSIRPAYEHAIKDSVNQDSLNANVDKVLKSVSGYYKNYRPNIDEKVFAALLKLYYDSTGAEFHPAILEQIKKEGYEKYAAMVFKKTVFTDSSKVTALLKELKANPKKGAKKLAADPAFKVLMEFHNMMKTTINPKFSSLTKQTTELQRKFMRGQMEYYAASKVLYPDANSTLRMSYGHAKGYEPRDALSAHYMTTLEGIIEKEDPNHDEFRVPKKLKELYYSKDFGQYGEKGKLPVAYIATNHTTGGNSGSPQINGKGELVGLNFDTVWEGTMSDINYDDRFSRNICVDIRYVLFIVDKFAGAKNIIDELKIVGSSSASR